MQFKIQNFLISIFGLAFLATLILFYFLPAFRGDIEVRPDIYLGPVKLHLYGLILSIAILAGFFVVLKLCSYYGIDKEHIENVLPWIVIFGLIGARFYYVIFSWNLYRENLLDIFKVWQGGLSIYGAILGGTLSTLIYAKCHNFPFLKLIDVLVLGVPLGQAIGRLGNFFNYEAFGPPTNLAWKMYIPADFRPSEYLHQPFFHPTFLYEALWDLLVFLFLLFLFSGKIRIHSMSRNLGFLAGCYFILYSLGRFFLETLRMDSFFINSLRLDQVTSLVMMGLGTAIIYISHSYEKHVVENN